MRSGVFGGNFNTKIERIKVKTMKNDRNYVRETTVLFPPYNISTEFKQLIS